MSNYINYCTIFDSSYMSRGLCMRESLLNNESNAYLFIFCMDNLSQEILSKMDLERTTIIGLNQLENKKLLKVKKERNIGEYCWTCKPFAIKYVLEHHFCSTCTYLDSDLFFFTSPINIQIELEQGGFLLTRHNYSSKYDQSLLSGIFCAQLIGFNNNSDGLNALLKWEELCLDWCFNRHENGKFGDQKYLEELSSLPSAIISKNLGCIGPWNMNNYNFENFNNKIKGSSLSGNDKFDIIFFHYHALNFNVYKNEINLGYYDVPKSAIKLLYNNIINKLIIIDLHLKKKYNIDSFDNKNEQLTFPKSLIYFFRKLIFNKPLILEIKNNSSSNGWYIKY